MKAVRITKENVDFLATRFGVETEDKEDLLPVGYVLVTDFGNDEKFDVLTVDIFNHNFNETGVTLDNDFFEVERD